MKCWCCDYVGDNIGSWMVDEQGDREVYKVVTKERTKAKRADTGFFFVLAAKIIQALDSKPGSCNQTCISFHL